MRVLLSSFSIALLSLSSRTCSYARETSDVFINSDVVPLPKTGDGYDGVANTVDPTHQLVKRAPPRDWFKFLGKNKVKEETPPLSETGHAVFMVDGEEGGSSREESGRESGSKREKQTLLDYRKHYEAVKREYKFLEEEVPGIRLEYETKEEEEASIDLEIEALKQRHGLTDDGLLPGWYEMLPAQRWQAKEYLAKVYGVTPSYFKGDQTELRDRRHHVLQNNVKAERIVQLVESGQYGDVPQMQSGYTKEIMDEYRQEIGDLKEYIPRRRILQDHGGEVGPLDIDIEIASHQAVRSIDIIRGRQDYLKDKASHLRNEIRQRHRGTTGDVSTSQG